MKDELAGRLLDSLMEWSDEEQSRWMSELRRMAAYKYDRYEGFAPGERFFERLARWLMQFNDPVDRRKLMEFVRTRLVFVSRDEINHAIASVYPDVIKSDLVASVSEQINLPWWRIKDIVVSADFRTLRRKTLYLGLSDGARLDQLRRSSPELSHEQFWLAPELGDHSREEMVEKLAEAIDKQGLLGGPVFERVVLVDDFYGSGTSLIRQNANGNFSGKLSRAKAHLAELNEADVVQDGTHVTVVLYLASAQAKHHIASTMATFSPDWTLHVIEHLPQEIVVDDARVIELCNWFFDDALIDEHKQGPVPIGYKDAALPLVLHHNTPNNSISLLWGDTANEPDSQERHALFPRYERHHVDRP